MPTFPRKEETVVTLVQRMINGFTAHPSVFPNADVGGLQAVLDGYKASKADQVEKEAGYRISTEQKDKDLARMELKMKDQLKLSEIDVGQETDRLDFIGWAPRAKPKPVAVPGPVRALVVVSQEEDAVSLNWDAPSRKKGGAVRTYRIERREVPAGGGSFDSWHEVGIAFKTEAKLEKQPRGVEMEYRVIGMNASGEGIASNVVDVVL